MGEVNNIALPNSIKKYTVILNPGHGAAPHPEGAKVKFNGKMIKESDLNDFIAQKVRDKFVAAGVNVIYADNKTLGEIQRLQSANTHSLFISIHCDSAAKKLSESTIYAGKGQKSLSLAKDLRAKIAPSNPISDRQIRTDKAAEFAVLRKDKAASILFECGNLNNKKDLEKLLSEDYQNDLAERIASGSLTYLQHSNPPLHKKQLSENSLFASNK